MTEQNANPETGAVTDVMSAVESLITQKPEADEQETPETEAAQEQEEEIEAADADAEAEPEDTDESDEPEDDEEADPEPDDRSYTVKVGGKEFEVNEAELLAGYQKGADYQQKTAALAEERRALEAEKQQTSQMRQMLAVELQKRAQAEEEVPDWAKLASELDPWEYQQKRAVWEGKQQERAQARAQAQALQAYQHQQVVTEGVHKLVESFPEWNGNPEKFESDKAEMQKYAREYGFTDHEFMGAVDHRQFKMLADAMKWRKMQKSSPATAKKVPRKVQKVLKPGVAATAASKEAKSVDARRKKLRQRGDVDSAVDYILGG